MSDVHYRNSTLLIALLLALVMAATRSHVLALPDASWAIFLLGGFYLRSALLFGVYMAEAVLIDYLVTTFMGVSDWCITPAYVFLLPTYGSLWLGGLWYARRHRLRLQTLAPLACAVAMSVSAAFLISNGSFYLLSGYFSDLTWTEYAVRVAKYFPRYALAAAAYVAFAALVHLLVARSAARLAKT